MRWRIVYVDGLRFSSEDGGPADAPGGGVLAIAQQDSTVGCLIHHGCDFYVWDRLRLGGWAGMDKFGLAQELILPGSKVVKLGQVMATDRYSLMLNELRECGLDKSARYSWERRDA